MKKIKQFVPILLFVLSINTVFAHSLWIETAATGKIGQSQSVKLYFGEYGQGERDELGKWRSDLKDLTLWLTSPDGKKEKLTVTQGTNYCAADFKPTQNGAYTLTVNHKLKDLSGTTQLEFLASSTVNVGGTKVFEPAANGNELKVLPVSSTKVNARVKLKVWMKGESKAGLTVLLFSPASWGQELTTDTDGIVSFIPLWPGKYVAEATAVSPGAGEFNGHSYTSLWQGATYSFEISK